MTLMTRERKYILVIGAILLFFASIYRFSPYIKGLGQNGGEIEELQQKIEELRQRTAQIDVYEQRLKAIRKEINGAESSLLSGDTPALAAAEIQNQVSGIMSLSGAEVNTVQVLKPEAAPQIGYSLIPVTFTFKTDIQQLKIILYRIEIAPKSLYVDNIRINVPDHKNWGKIRCVMTVTGIFHG